MKMRVLVLVAAMLSILAAAACGSEPAATSTPTPVPVATPQGFSALTVHDRLTIQLMWQEYAQDGASLVIERAVGQESGPWSELAVVEAGETSYMDSDGLTDGTIYYYRMKARMDNRDSAYTPVVNAEATDLPRPSGS